MYVLRAVTDLVCLWRKESTLNLNYSVAFGQNGLSVCNAMKLINPNSKAKHNLLTPFWQHLIPHQQILLHTFLLSERPALCTQLHHVHPSANYAYIYWHNFIFGSLTHSLLVLTHWRNFIHLEYMNASLIPTPFMSRSVSGNHWQLRFKWFRWPKPAGYCASTSQYCEWNRW